MKINSILFTHKFDLERNTKMWEVAPAFLDPLSATSNEMSEINSKSQRKVSFSNSFLTLKSILPFGNNSLRLDFSQST